jgi:hypothetical protein
VRESGDRHEIMERTSDAGAVRKNKNAVIDRESTEGAGRLGWASLGCIQAFHAWLSFCERDWRVFRAQQEAPRQG